jgi:hypothetical protein
VRRNSPHWDGLSATTWADTVLQRAVFRAATYCGQMSNPPGHIPGFHIPGTYMPIGAAEMLSRQPRAYFPPLTEEQKKAAGDEERRKLKNSRAAIAKEEDALAEVAPGFPVRSISAQALADVLERLVPRRTVQIVVGTRMFGRKRYAEGWGLSLGVRKPRNFPLEQREALIVLRDGRAFRPSAHYSSEPDSWLDTPYLSPQIETVGSGDLRRLRRQVLAWMGHQGTYTASVHDHYAVDDAGRRQFILRRDWEAEFGWD